MYIPKEYSAHAIAAELGIDRRKAAAILASVPAVRVTEKAGKQTKYWLMKDAARAVFVPKDEQALDLNKERARLAREQADKIAMENAIFKQEIFRAEEIGAHWIEIVTNARARLLTLPTRAAAIAVQGRTLADIETQIREIVYEALDELAASPYPDGTHIALAEVLEVPADPDGQSVGRSVSKAKQRSKRRARAMAD